MEIILNESQPETMLRLRLLVFLAGLYFAESITKVWLRSTCFLQSPFAQADEYAKPNSEGRYAACSWEHDVMTKYDRVNSNLQLPKSPLMIVVSWIWFKAVGSWSWLGFCPILFGSRRRYFWLKSHLLRVVFQYISIYFNGILQNPFRQLVSSRQLVLCPVKQQYTKIHLQMPALSHQVALQGRHDFMKIQSLSQVLLCRIIGGHVNYTDEVTPDPEVSSSGNNAASCYLLFSTYWAMPENRNTFCSWFLQWSDFIGPVIWGAGPFLHWRAIWHSLWWPWEDTWNIQAGIWPA